MTALLYARRSREDDPSDPGVAAQLETARQHAESPRLHRGQGGRVQGLRHIGTLD